MLTPRQRKENRMIRKLLDEVLDDRKETKKVKQDEYIL